MSEKPKPRPLGRGSGFIKAKLASIATFEEFANTDFVAMTGEDVSEALRYVPETELEIDEDDQQLATAIRQKFEELATPVYQRLQSSVELNALQLDELNTFLDRLYNLREQFPVVSITAHEYVDSFDNYIALAKQLLPKND